MAEFKLGRIRFVWKDAWTGATVYYKDDVVRVGGRTYVCVIGHTASADFYTDLNFNPTRWNQMSDGQEWREDWARYMDDMILLDNDSSRLRDMKDALEQFAADKMRLRFSKWSIAPVSRGVNFLGYRIWPRYKLLRKQSVTGAKRAIKSLKARGEAAALNRFLAAWTGHASWADTHHLMEYLEAQ